MIAGTIWNDGAVAPGGEGVNCWNGEDVLLVHDRRERLFIMSPLTIRTKQEKRRNAYDIQESIKTIAQITSLKLIGERDIAGAERVILERKTTKLRKSLSPLLCRDDPSPPRIPHQCEYDSRLTGLSSNPGLQQRRNNVPLLLVPAR